MPAKKGLYANIHAKRKRIAAGSGEKMRKPGAKGAPTAANFRRSAKTAKKKQILRGDPKLSSSPQVFPTLIITMITTEYGKQNIHANETPPRVIPNYPINKNPIMTNEAERFNGWAAMLGFVAALGAYITTGQIIPGIF